MKVLVTILVMLLSIQAQATFHLKSCSNNEITIKADSTGFRNLGDLISMFTHSDKVKVTEEGFGRTREEYQEEYNIARVREVKAFKFYNSLNPTLNITRNARVLETATYRIIHSEVSHSSGDVVIQNKKTGKIHKLNGCTSQRID